MASSSIYVSGITAWAPGLSSDEDWALWTAGRKQIVQAKESPKLEYTDPLFRRRLSQISRMTIQVVHDLLEKTDCGKNIKQVFISCRGEIEREFTINRSLIEDNEILPAGFSLSVFNTPVALATIAFKLKGGYSVIYPSKGDFRTAFKGACAPVLCGAEKKVMVIYADEYVPDSYGKIQPQPNEPFAFAAVLSREQTDNAKFIRDINSVSNKPAQFLKSIMQ